MGMTINSLANNELSKDFMKLANGKRINSAADDAAGLAIAEKLQSEVNGLEQGTRNTVDMNNLVQTADSGLSGINDNLQRVRELGIQASNGTLTDADRALAQEEIGQLMEGITSTVNETQFNNKNLLDGSFSNQNTASGPDGTGPQVNIPNMSVESLGIQDFNVTKDFDISSIDDAIRTVNDSRAQLGALSNRLENTVNANNIAMLNQAAARSSIADADMANVATEQSRNRVQNDYQLFAQRREQENMRSQMNVTL